MLRVFQNSNLNAEVQTIVNGDELYFKGKNICDALGYERSREAIRSHVSEENKIRMSEIKGASRNGPLYNAQPHCVFVNESGLYELIFSSTLPAAKEFRRWVMKDVLPSIRKTGKYEKHRTPRLEIKTFKIENENDLHDKVVDYIRRFHPDLLFIAGLGELQDTPAKRINSWRKGYTKGQPDLIITSYHKKYKGFCIEFKTPKGNCVTSDNQRELLKRYENNNYKTIISNDYERL